MKRVRLPIANYSSINFLKTALAEIREATNKAWVLGNDRFKQRIQEQLGRRVEPKARGGDRKSEQFNAKRVFSLGRKYFILSDRFGGTIPQGQTI